MAQRNARAVFARGLGVEMTDPSSSPTTTAVGCSYNKMLMRAANVVQHLQGVCCRFDNF